MNVSITYLGHSPTHVAQVVAVVSLSDNRFEIFVEDHRPGWEKALHQNIKDRITDMGVEITGEYRTV
jgi:N6-adenosine-specific RNA methylase IME4